MVYVKENGGSGDCSCNLVLDTGPRVQKLGSIATNQSRFYCQLENISRNLVAMGNLWCLCTRPIVSPYAEYSATYDIPVKG